ncbi:S-methyl-5-thioribose kinase [Jannaschia sp.]|nr:S-methyl-5-thioribose kinase [Jannaschia sp.]
MDGTEASGRVDPRAEALRIPDFAAYVPLTVEVAATRLAALPEIAERLGGAPADWTVSEVGDGNLNYVYIVEGPAGSVCAKQALPYVRLVGESWPLPLDRAIYEHAALTRQAADAGPGIVPEILAFVPDQALIVMENLSGHVIWRNALIDRQRHDSAAPVLGRFCAETLFRSSDLSLDPALKKREMGSFAGNAALARISEDLIFTDPYHDHEMNAVTPGLEDAVAEMRADPAWRRAIQEWKWAFMTRAEALLHGDLHSGSVMVSPAGPQERVRIIDPEFAFYGPMGFDLGAVLANLWLNAAAQPGWGDGWQAQQNWVLDQGVAFWDSFAARFRELWRAERRGEAMVARVLDPDAEAALEAMLTRVQADALGFAGAKMTRRIVGLAGVADLRTIPDDAARVACEARGLRLAGRLVKEPADIGSVAATTDMARAQLRP